MGLVGMQFVNKMPTSGSSGSPPPGQPSDRFGTLNPTASSGTPSGKGGSGAGGGRGPGGGEGGGSGAGGSASGDLASAVGEAGTGLLDPNSDYYQRLMDGMKTRLGKESEAAQRAAALRASRSGMGAGASPELLETQGEIGIGGLNAQGEAGANLRLEAPKLGAGMALGAGNLALGGEQLTEGGRQFDEGLAWNKDSFGQNMDQRQTEYGGNMGNAAADRQAQADATAASAATAEAQFQQQMDFAMQQLYG